ncbi:MAG: histidine triad nucleotide-binding protein [Patescibacteria group bacterium]|nr:histidine triad nucleotide-binding protein [Patescibacteria group bacterium]
MSDCVFCNIVNKVLASNILLETEDLIVINDILPKAPVHMLIIPKKHILSINHLEPEDAELGGKLLEAAKEMAKRQGISESGYRLVFNVGKDGGQVIPHLHLHLLGGKKFTD